MMKLGDMSFFSLASRRMEWLGARQQVISQNIANADTPGFAAQDITPFREVLSGQTLSGVTTTNTKHISGSGGSINGMTTQDDPNAWSKSINGNSVVLEQQTINSAEVSENYRLAAQLYKKGHDLLSLAFTGIR